jgi:hypothetical protein
MEACRFDVDAWCVIGKEEEKKKVWSFESRSRSSGSCSERLVDEL